MKIFISWHGDRSEALAIALKELLPLVLYYAEPWLSKSDIGAGERWSDEIAKGLEDCNFGISCVTRENQDAPWILFEAGAIAKSVKEGKVMPLLLDLDKKEVSGPLAQFQAKKVEEGEIRELVSSLNKSATNPVEAGKLEKLFAMAWPDLEVRIAAIPKTKAAPKPSRPEGEILEELVSGFRNLEMRFMVMKDMDAKNRDLEMHRMELETRLMVMHEEEADWRRRNAYKPRGKELMKMIRRIASGPGDPMQILFASSFLRDDAPWFYELALDTYRAIRSGNRAEARISHKRLMEAFKMLQSTPLLDEIGPEVKVLSMVFEECQSAIEDMDNAAVEKASRSFEEELRETSGLKAVSDASVKNPTE